MTFPGEFPIWRDGDGQFLRHVCLRRSFPLTLDIGCGKSHIAEHLNKVDSGDPLRDLVCAGPLLTRVVCVLGGCAADGPVRHIGEKSGEGPEPGAAVFTTSV